MALPILDGNQTAATLSTIVTGGQHIPAHTVVSLGSQAISDISSAVSGAVVTIPSLARISNSAATEGVVDPTLNFIKIGGHQDGSNQIAHIVHVSAGGAMKVDASGSSVTFSQAAVTFGQASVTFGTTDSNSHLKGLVSTGNSTTTTLGIGGTFTGSWEDVTDYATLTIQAYSNVASSTGGWKLQWSTDGVNMDKEESLTLSAGAGRALAINVRSRYFRVVYTNGGSAQSSFRLGTIYRPSGNGMNNYALNTQLTDTTLAVMTRSVIVGEATGGGGGYHNVKVNPSGALAAEISGEVSVTGTTSVTFSAVTGSVSILNLPATQAIAGTVTANGYDGANDVYAPIPLNDGANAVRVRIDETNGSLPISGTVTANDSGALSIVDSSTVTKADVKFTALAGTQSPGGSNYVMRPILTSGNGTLLVDAQSAGASVLGYDGYAHVRVAQSPFSVVTVGSLPAISGTVTVGAMPNGALTTRFGSVTTANTAQITSAVTNASRKYLLAQNISAGTVTIGIGFSPTTTQGIQLTAGAGITFESSYIPTGAVYVLSSVTASNFTILEA